jgi:hypothetical protein
MSYHQSEFTRTKGDVTFAGVLFESYRIGVNSYALISSDGRCKVKRNYNRSTYYAAVDGVIIGQRYQTQQAALTAAFDKAYTHDTAI